MGQLTFNAPGFFMDNQVDTALSTVAVSLVPSNVLDVYVTLNGLSATGENPGIQFLLVSPNQTSNLAIFDYISNGIDPGVNITLRDNASQPVPQNGPLTNNAVYRPTVYNTFVLTNPPNPVPTTPYNFPEIISNRTFHDSFVNNNIPLNGNWVLYGQCQGGQANTASLVSWSITFVFGNAPCLHPNTLVTFNEGYQIKEKMICEIRKGDYVTDKDGKKVLVISNLRFPNNKDFIKIESGALGKDEKGSLIPANDLIIRKGHPILLNGIEIDPISLVRKKCKGVRKIKLEDPVGVWSLATRERTFVMMEGVPVATWAYHDILTNKKFKNFVQY